MSDYQRIHGVAPAPPPSAKLLAAVAELQPVRTRAPLRSLVVVGLVSLLAPAAFTLLNPLRPDLPYLPLAWFVAVAVVWFGAFAILLPAALLPVRGQVAPDTQRALQLTLTLLAIVAVIAFVATVDAPGHTLLHPDGSPEFWRRVVGCGTFAVVLALAPIVAGLVVLRRVVPIGSWRAGAAVGAAGGALGGLVLHLLCPIGGLHVGVSHAGAAVVCALLGGLLFRTLHRG